MNSLFSIIELPFVRLWMLLLWLLLLLWMLLLSLLLLLLGSWANAPNLTYGTICYVFNCFLALRFVFTFAYACVAPAFVVVVVIVVVIVVAGFLCFSVILNCFIFWFVCVFLLLFCDSVEFCKRPLKREQVSALLAEVEDKA